MIKRREFLGFFLIGGLLGLLRKKLRAGGVRPPKKAMFWRRMT